MKQLLNTIQEGINQNCGEAPSYFSVKMAIFKNAKYRQEAQTTMCGDRNPWTLVAGMKISKDFMGRIIEDPQKQLKIEDSMKLQPHYRVFSPRA